MEYTQGNSTEALVFTMVSAADHLTPMPGLAPAVNLSKNGFPFAPPAGVVTEVGLGVYRVTPNALDFDTLGPLILHAAAPGADNTIDIHEVIEAPAVPTPIPPSDAIQLTAAQLIERALSTLGKHTPGERIRGELLEEALGFLNELVDNWKTQKLMIAQLTRVEYPLTPGTTELTIGPGGDINMERPYAVRFAFMQDPSNPAVERPIYAGDDVAYAGLAYKVMAGQTSVSAVYYLPEHPVGKLKIPAGNAGGTLVLYVLIGLPRFDDLVTPYLLMPGYALALRLSLAVMLGPSYGVSIGNDLRFDADRAVGDVKRINQRHHVLVNYFGGRVPYNIFTDEP